jgi:hypothetical protein
VPPAADDDQHGPSSRTRIIFVTTATSLAPWLNARPPAPHAYRHRLQVRGDDRVDKVARAAQARISGRYPCQVAQRAATSISLNDRPP